MQTDLVIVSEYCQKCHIDPSFIILLEEGGLIDINITDGERYLFSSQLRDLEQYTRMYYDLSINIEGIEAIHHMLDRVLNPVSWDSTTLHPLNPLPSSEGIRLSVITPYFCRL